VRKKKKLAWLPGTGRGMGYPLGLADDQIYTLFLNIKIIFMIIIITSFYSGISPF
jgi:hypothetical protein